MFNGKKVAFVASGGGGRAIAHIGVIRACHRLGIKFDILVGASAGAVAAVMYNQHNGNTDMMLDHFRPFWKRKYKFPQFNWGTMISFKRFFSRRIKSGIFDLYNAEKFLRKTLYTNKFSELSIPTYVSATNLDTKNGDFFGPDINSDIPISRALIASCCVPVIFRPVKINNVYYIDGEVKRPLAIEMAIEKGADIVIVSDIYTPHIAGIGTSNMFNIFTQIINMLIEDKSMRGVKICQEHFPDKKIILVSPAVGDISSLSTRYYKKLELAGYNSAIKVLLNEVDCETRFYK